MSRLPMRLNRLYLRSQHCLDGLAFQETQALHAAGRRGFCGHPFHRRIFSEHHHTDHHVGRRNLFRTLDEEFQKMREAFGNSGRSAGDVYARAANLRGFAAADLQETEKSLIMKIDLPGLKKQDIKVQMTADRMLTISGKREAAIGISKDLPNTMQRVERSSGAFKRQWQLPESADASSIAARAEDGVLTIEVQKLEPAAAGISEITIA